MPASHRKIQLIMRVQKARVGLIGVALLAALLGGARQSEAVVLFDNFDVGDSYNPSIGLSFALNALSIPGYNVGLAYAFTFSGGPYFLDRVEVALSSNEGPNEVDVRLLTDNSGEPDQILEVFHFSGAMGPVGTVNPLLGADSALRPILQPASQYWLAAIPTDSGTRGIWNINVLGDQGTLAAQDLDTQNWTVQGTPFPRGAFRVSGTVIPEPSSLILLGSGLLGLVGWRRRFLA